ncbi:MAG: DUF2953 domain-containing protein [Acutalibacteraceae bacterium]|nr:DUF2953 domain-containing protein [Acutalibacteraceae bacterium]
MTALVIILSILAVIVLLMFFSVNLYIDYKENKTTIWIRYLFFKIPIYPRKKKKAKKQKSDKKTEKKAKKPSKDKSKEKKDGFFSSTLKSQGLSAVIEILEKIIKILKDFSSSTLKHLKIKNLKLDVISAGEDAADAAINFGYACSVVYPILGVLSALINFLNVPDVNITVDYDKKETLASLFLQFKIKLFFLLGIILKYSIKGILLYIDITKTDTNENDLPKQESSAVKN